MSDQIRRLSAFLAAVALAAVPASAASAHSVSGPVPAPAYESALTTLVADDAPDRPHCVVTARTAGDRSAVPEPRCFRTFAEAIAEATEGAVQLHPAAQTLTRKHLREARAINRTAALLGIEYDQAGFGTGSWSYTIQGPDSTGCRSGVKYRVPNLPSTRDNAISSARTYSGCKSRHFSEPNLTGNSHLCGCASMGALDNKTSSIRFSSTGSRVP